MIITAIVSTAVLSCTSSGEKPSGGTAGTEKERSSGMSAAGNGSEKDTEGSFSLLVYMIGSDLESFDAAASKDIQEMLGAASGDRLNIIIQTGGSKTGILKRLQMTE